MSDKKAIKGMDGESYDRVVDRVMEAVDSASELSAQKLSQLVGETIELEAAAVDLSIDEAHLLRQYLLRDFNRFKQSSIDIGHAIQEGLQLDLALLERSVIDRLFKVADPTRIGFERLREQLGHEDDQYSAGELALPGRFVCVACQEEQTLYKSNALEACPSCFGVLFERASP